MQANDPVGGYWAVGDATNAVVWCDASNLAVGMCMEVDGAVVEGSSWLRKKQDVMHINLAGLKELSKWMEYIGTWQICERC